jgi:hypothetical protein
MDKRSFYEGKTLAKVEWWLSYCSEYPDLKKTDISPPLWNDAGAEFEYLGTY